VPSEDVNSCRLSLVEHHLRSSGLAKAASEQYCQLSTEATDRLRRISLPARIISCRILCTSSSDLRQAFVLGTLSLQRRREEATPRGRLSSLVASGQDPIGALPEFLDKSNEHFCRRRQSSTLDF
jgi:hypothetical protein